MGVSRKMLYAAALAAGLTAGAGAAPVRACEIALALAVDISGSVDPREYALQMDGLLAALGDPSVTEALMRARAAVTVVQWTGAGKQDVVVGWQRIETPDDIARIAELARTAERRWYYYATAIGDALRFTAALFDEVADCRRRVIDVSGDGTNNEGLHPAALRADLRAAGFTVNGLAIETDVPKLSAYYRENVIVGDLAFVMTAQSFADYPEKIRRKLLREVTEQVSLLAPAAQPKR